MTDPRIRKIVAVISDGGGMAGCLAAFGTSLGRDYVRRLIEFEETGSLNGGEGTVPRLKSSENIRLVRHNGLFFRNAEELFAEPSWVQVMLGQRLVPATHHPLVDELTPAQLQQLVDNVGEVIEKCVEAMPAHQAFIDRHCRASDV